MFVVAQRNIRNLILKVVLQGYPDDFLIAEKAQESFGVQPLSAAALKETWRGQLRILRALAQPWPG